MKRVWWLVIALLTLLGFVLYLSKREIKPVKELTEGDKKQQKRKQ